MPVRRACASSGHTPVPPPSALCPPLPHPAPALPLLPLCAPLKQPPYFLTTQKFQSSGPTRTLMAEGTSHQSRGKLSPTSTHLAALGH